MAKSNKKQERRNRIVMGFFIVFLMVTSVFGIIGGMGSEDGSQSYNNHVFTQEGNIWITNIDGNPYYFDYFPSDTLIIPLPEGIPQKIESANVVLFTYDPYPSVGEINQTIYLIQRSIFFLGYSVENKYGKSVVSGVINSSEFPEYKEITCEDATFQVPVVYFTFGNESRIYEDSECIVVEAVSPTDFNILKDRLNVALVLDNG